MNKQIVLASLMSAAAT
jgi:hypothetical protein